MPERYTFNTRDRGLLQAATILLKKIAAAETLQPAKLVSVAKLQHVLSVLPRVTHDLQVIVQVIGPRRKFGESETRHHWEVAVEEERLSISSGGHFFRPSTGGDSFTTMTWAAIPEEASAMDDYGESLWMVPDVLSFPDGVASIDFASGDYSVEVSDSDNPLLEEGEENDEQSADDEAVEEPEDEGNEQSGADEETSRNWSITPIDAIEERLASVVDPDQVDANEPAHTSNVQNCDFCGCALDRRGLFVDGRLRDNVRWGNMCAVCFGNQGMGIGWGKGQLYAKQADGKWRMVAGWRPSDA